MKEGSYYDYMRKNFFAFFLWYPLLTLVILPIFFIIYGGSFDNFKLVLIRLMTLENAIKYFCLLVISYFGHVTYAWTRVRNPTYIKKQEAYEKWKVEKEAAKQKADEQAQLKK